MDIFFLIFTIALIGIFMVTIKSLIDYFTINSAIHSNKLLVYRMKEKETRSNYHTQELLVEHAMALLRGKMKRYSYHELEDKVAKHVSTIGSSFRNFMVVSFKLLLVFSLPWMILTTSVTSIAFFIDEPSSKSAEPVEAVEEEIVEEIEGEDPQYRTIFKTAKDAYTAKDFAAAKEGFERIPDTSGYFEKAQDYLNKVELDQAATQLFNEAKEAYNQQQWETSIEKLTTISEDSSLATEAKKLLNDATKEFETFKVYMSGIQNYEAHEFEGAKELLEQVEEESFYFSEATAKLKTIKEELYWSSVSYMEYYEVVKRHQEYTGQTLGFWGEIIDIMEYNGKTILVLATIWDEYYQDYYSGNVIFLYNGKTEYKIGQEIGIAGKMEGLYLQVEENYFISDYLDSAYTFQYSADQDPNKIPIIVGGAFYE